MLHRLMVLTLEVLRVATHRIERLAGCPGHHRGDQDEHLPSGETAHLLVESYKYNTRDNEQKISQSCSTKGK